MRKIFLIYFSFLLTFSVQAQWIHNGSYLTTLDNIGIGISTPSNKFHVKGSGHLIRFESTDNGADASSALFLDVGNKSRARIVWHKEGTDENLGGLSFGTRAKDNVGIATRMYISGSGNVGIGIDAPSNKLHVKGSGDLIRFEGAETDVSSSMILNVGGTSRARINWHDEAIPGLNSGGLSFGTRTGGSSITTKMYISGNGRVGIGTLTPQNMLSVKGAIWAEEVKVSLLDAPDWVFEEDYELKSLEEVEQYIQYNKHLPGIPSADEFRENDLNVAEMDSKLLQKIEELTLYLIEQNKKIEAQEVRMQTIEAKNLELERKLVE